MAFRVSISHVGEPLSFYDGGEPSVCPLEVIVCDRTTRIDVDLRAPECRQWRHYYSDAELNELVKLLGLTFLFRTNRELLVEPRSRREIYFQPVVRSGQELGICFTYDEVSNGHYVFWLVAVTTRVLAESEFLTRVETIKKYWVK